MLHTLLSLRSALGAFIYIIVQGARLACCVFAPGQTNALNGGKLKGKLEGYGYGDRSNAAVYFAH